MKDKPLVVVVSRERGVKNAIRGINCELLSIPNVRRLLTEQFPRPPRLFAIQSTNGEVERTREVVTSLRRDWPLTDVLIWAPQASGSMVRTFFQAGAKDVVLSQSVSKLADAVDETLEHQQFLSRVSDLSRGPSRGGRFESMFSRSVSMWDLFDVCIRVAPADATVLIVGETGTGKELLARAVHRRSGRRGRFVAANCASIPPELINSALFGHEKGAFTGADRVRKGLVMHANEGTLFLDEIGDMPPEGQQSLLRTLQEKRVRPVGSQTETDVDVRVVAATNVMLEDAVRDGAFREDLFYRLDVIRMNVPALRERPEDILFLFGHFAKKLSKHYGLHPPTFSDSFLDALVKYDWPGNVRQLENFSERLVLSRPQRALTMRDFTKLLSNRMAGKSKTKRSQSIGPTGETPKSIDLSTPLQDGISKLVEQFEREYVACALKQNAGRVAGAAKQAGISRRTLLRKMIQYDINKEDFK